MTEVSTKNLSISTSRNFPDWLQSSGGSLAITTYQAGKIILLGLSAEGRLSAVLRDFPRCMGAAATSDGRSLFLATHVQIYRLNNILPANAWQSGHDGIYAPHVNWVTGDLDVHDIGVGRDGRPIFANTLFNCLATTSDGHSFKPLWKPPFISRLAAEDRCHLNGLAMDDGVPKFVTCISRSDVADGWRDRRSEGGLVIDVASNEVVAANLSMPHSPRLREGRLWLLNSGAGEFGWIDLQSGKFNAVAFCPGYARGLTFVGHHAVIGLSLPRDNQTFAGLPLDSALEHQDVNARCGLLIVDLRSGDTIEWVRVEGVINELFDVVALRGVRCPTAIGTRGNDIRRVIAIADA